MKDDDEESRTFLVAQRIESGESSMHSETYPKITSELQAETRRKTVMTVADSPFAAIETAVRTTGRVTIEVMIKTIIKSRIRTAPADGE